MEKDRISPSFWRKIVYILECKTCGELVCRRAMRAILLADNTISLFSTDAPDPTAIAAIPDIFITAHCLCKIQNIACLCCGSLVGYHVVTPCEKCMRSCNNGHFWMFHSSSVSSFGRMNEKDDDYMIWKELPAEEEDDFPSGECCR
ncbi:protein FAM72A-like [Pomacea canaliculata]|uniref:protein FAM72A-like n=1 Tax=Pomacea canaliculata TaxID=400727 RepID=UPI000D729C7F|nr:protein FAM72A-like [Pomacea canaliculata]